MKAKRTFVSCLLSSLLGLAGLLIAVAPHDTHWTVGQADDTHWSITDTHW